MFYRIFILFRQFQRLALAASAGIGEKKPKGESAVGAESLKVWATPALVRGT
jgi:hypothetical protein